MTVHIRKKRKIEQNVTGDVLGQVVADFDLEIGIRRRLAEAAEARIAWATLLQQGLREGQETSSLSYKNVAIAALDAIETPLNPIFFREPLPQEWVPIPAPVQAAHRPLLSYKPPPKPAKPSFLFIRSTDLESSNAEGLIQTYLLRCPECLRTAFTSLQGLFNHARLSHRLEWGTHDDCVRACAVLDPDLEVNAGFEVGLGPHGLLPGLRSLFRMAVGGEEHASAAAMEVDAADATDDLPSSFGSLLSRTLGLHEDSPALAPFLGKQVTRRGIKIWEEDVVDVDTDGIGTSTSKTVQAKPSWRMHYSHRSDFNPSQAEALDDPPIEDTNKQGSEHPETRLSNTSVDAPSIALHEGGRNSRFHFSTRLVVTDRSFWIPPTKRGGSEDTHKWMLSVDSPAYSHHVSTVLHKMSVSPFSGEAFPPKTVTQPPFVIVGRASQSFLAKIELSFGSIADVAGELVPQRVILEHWVELDLEKGNNPVGGDEQVVDVELDKRTALVPSRKNYTPIGARALWNDEHDKSQDRAQVQNKPAYVLILLELLQEFPMTAKDVHRNQPLPILPYKLATTPYQFKNMVTGRRKAIEWSRATLIRDAYTTKAEDPANSGLELPVLSTADVFRWLSDEGHFLRAPSQNLTRGALKKDSGEDTTQEHRWCAVCGKLQSPEKDNAVKMEYSESCLPPFKIETEEKVSETPRPQTCGCSDRDIRTRFPIVNILTRLKPPVVSSELSSQGRFSSVKLPTNDQIIRSADPQLTMSIWKIAHSLNLSNVPSPTESEFPLGQLGADHSAVQSALGPHAFLALVLKPFVRELVQGGLEYSAKTKEGSTDGTSSRRKRTNKKRGDKVFDLLTPTQILNGIASRATEARKSRGDMKNIAIYELLSRLGAPVEASGTPEETAESTSLDRTVHIKAEPRDLDAQLRCAYD